MDGRFARGINISVRQKHASTPFPPIQACCFSMSLNMPVFQARRRSNCSQPQRKDPIPPPMYHQAYVRHTQGVIKTAHKFPYEAYCLIRKNLLQKTSLQCVLLEVKQPSYPAHSTVRGELRQPSYLSLTGSSLANPTLHL